VREACTIPGISARTAYLCRDKVAMKEVQREAGVPCAASVAVSSSERGQAVRGGGRFPADRQAARRSRRLGHVPDGRQGAARARLHVTGVAQGARGDRGIRRGPRALLRHAGDRWPHRPRLHQPLLPQRARGDARPLDLTAVRRDQSHGRAGLRRGQGDGPTCDRGPRHRHCRPAHGVVLRPEGPQVLRDRLPAARRRPLGRVLRRQRVRPVSGNGRWPSATGRWTGTRRAATPVA
jgi:hypothetical protein